MILLSVSGGAAALTSNNYKILHFYLFEHKVHDRREAVYVGGDCSSIPTDAPSKAQRNLFQECVTIIAHFISVRQSSIYYCLLLAGQEGREGNEGSEGRDNPLLVCFTGGSG